MKMILLILANIIITIITVGSIGMIKDNDSGKETLLLKIISLVLSVGIIILWIWKKVL
jgi:ABC-type polysaccharide/polyol phosphate transport system ATPase subunit